MQTENTEPNASAQMEQIDTIIDTMRDCGLERQTDTERANLRGHLAYIIASSYGQGYQDGRGAGRWGRVVAFADRRRRDWRIFTITLRHHARSFLNLLKEG